MAPLNAFFLVPVDGAMAKEMRRGPKTGTRSGENGRHGFTYDDTAATVMKTVRLNAVQMKELP